MKNGSARDEQRVGPLACDMVANAASMSRSVLAFNDDELQPERVGGRLHVSRHWSRVTGVGRVDEHAQRRSLRAPARAAAPSASTPTRVLKKLTPVTLPPGRARLATSPSPTGSATPKTIGIVAVAAFAATRRNVTRVATITATRRRTRSAASAGSRSFWFSAQRYSIATFSALDVAGFLQALAERAQGFAARVRRCAVEESDHGMPAAARAPRAATSPPRHPEHREIPAASCPPLGSGDGIVTAQTSTLIGAETGFATAT